MLRQGTQWYFRYECIYLYTVVLHPNQRNHNQHMVQTYNEHPAVGRRRRASHSALPSAPGGVSSVRPSAGAARHAAAPVATHLEAVAPLHATAEAQQRAPARRDPTEIPPRSQLRAPAQRDLRDPAATGTRHGGRARRLPRGAGRPAQAGKTGGKIGAGKTGGKIRAGKTGGKIGAGKTGGKIGVVPARAGKTGGSRRCARWRR